MPVERDENARLIAAAPDLLAALKTLTPGWEALKPGDPYRVGPIDYAAVAAARAAIAKAEGAS